MVFIMDPAPDPTAVGCGGLAGPSTATTKLKMGSDGMTRPTPAPATADDPRLTAPREHRVASPTDQVANGYLNQLLNLFPRRTGTYRGVNGLDSLMRRPGFIGFEEYILPGTPVLEPTRQVQVSDLTTFTADSPAEADRAVRAAESEIHISLDQIES